MYDPRTFAEMERRAALELANGGNMYRPVALQGEFALLDSTEVMIQDQGGDFEQPAADFVTIQSTLASDSRDLGTGCQTVIVTGVSENFDNGGDGLGRPYQTDFVATDGEALVATARKFAQVLEISIPLNPPGFPQFPTGVPLGQITAKIGGTVVLVILVGQGRSHAAIQLIPLGWRGYASPFDITWPGGAFVTMTCPIVSPGQVTFGGFLRTFTGDTTQNVPLFPFPGGTFAHCMAEKGSAGPVGLITVSGTTVLERIV